MYLNKKDIIKEINFYNKILDITKDLTGNLDIDKCRRIDIKSKKYGFEYYMVEKIDGKLKRNYIKNNHISQIKSCFQYNYLIKVEDFAIRRLEILYKLLDLYDSESLDLIYDRLHPGKKCLISPIIPTYSQALQTWQNKPYKNNNTFISDKDLFSNKGEKVKSKTELMLADLFFAYNISYKYECPLSINNSFYYPDFTFLNPSTRKEIYWEHFGRMDDPEYASKTIKKIVEYSKSGIILGKNLIVTFETSDNILSKRMALQLLKEYGLLDA